MLEIFILISVGRAIANKAKSKDLPGWPFVIILIIFYIGGAIAGASVALVASGGLAANEDDNLLPLILGYLGGAALGATASYIIVAALPDRSEPDRDAGRRRRERDYDGDDDIDDLPVRKARREDADDGYDRRRDY